MLLPKTTAMLMPSTRLFVARAIRARPFVKRSMSSPKAFMAEKHEGFGATDYGDMAQKLVGAVNKLRAVNAQYSVDLPSLVVTGNQSAGKSSVMERVSGVKLPRNKGTCTKCPTEIRLSSEQPVTGDAWQCQIKLRKEYDTDGKPIPNTREEVFITLGQDQKDLLHFFVSAAQRALLNPDQASSKFVGEAEERAAAAAAAAAGDSAGSTPNGSDSDDLVLEAATGPKDALTFTKNVVVLEIRSP